MVIALLMALGLAWAGEAPASGYTDRLGLAAALAEQEALPLACVQLQEIVEDPESDRERRLALQLAEQLNERDPYLCAFVADGLDKVPLPRPDARRGVVELALAEGILGFSAGFGSVLIYSDLRAGAAEGGGLGLLLGGAGVLAVVLVDRSAPLTEAQAMTIYGSQLGATFLGLGLEFVVSRDDPRLIFGPPSFLVGTLLGIAAAAARPDMPAGDVALVRSAFTWGIGLGVLAGQIPEPGEARVQLGRAVSGALLGGFVGMAFTPLSRLDRRDVVLLNVGAWGGVSLGAAVGVLAAGSGRRSTGPIAVTTTTGGVLGLLGMAVVVESRRRSQRERYTALPTSGPGLVQGPDGRVHPGIVVQGRW